VLKVHRITCSLDPNFVVNPDIATAQLEGGIVQGLSAALTGQITFEGGQVQQSNFHDYRFLRINEMPEIDMHLMPSLGKYGDRWVASARLACLPSRRRDQRHPRRNGTAYSYTSDRSAWPGMGAMMARGTRLAMATVAAAGLGGLLATSLSGQTVHQPSDRARSAAHFTRIATVLQHPRCMNCHTSTGFPRQGDDRRPHIMNVRRGPSDTGTLALQCSACTKR